MSRVALLNARNMLVGSVFLLCSLETSKFAYIRIQHEEILKYLKRYTFRWITSSNKRTARLEKKGFMTARLTLETCGSMAPKAEPFAAKHL